ncbi:MAG: carboxypeptidase regulatory-like domain-containing protein [Taibaiella sp.]|nr:carboxypeptidase regulatory-like domain-containing protein [Taibaiella sp.]
MARTLRYLFVLLFLGVSFSASAQSVPGEISGIVLDTKGEPVIGAIVVVTEGNIQKGGAQTDDVGRFIIKPVDAGRYDVSASYAGLQKTVISNVVVNSDKTTGLKFTMQDKSSLKEVQVTAYKVPLIDSNSSGPNTTISREAIKDLPTHNTADMVALAANTYQQKSGGGISIAGGRGDGNQVIIDGVQTNGSTYNLPASSIDQIEIMPSGISAKYGNLTGGVINIVTRGATQKLAGSIFAEHSLDGYNNNIFNFSLSGPLYKKRWTDSNGNKQSKNIIGFFLGGDYQYDKDDNPSYNGNYVANNATLNSVRNNPLVTTTDANGQRVYKYATEYVNNSNLTYTKANPNSLAKVVRLNGKLDFHLQDNLSLTAGGTFTYANQQQSSRGFSLFAPEATPEVNSLTGRAWVRFTQKFGKANSTDKSGVISNAYYTIQADYQITTSSYQDPRFKHNIFDYLYVGKFNQITKDIYAPDQDTATKKLGILYEGRAFTGVTFQRSDLNPSLANYTSEYYNTAGYTPVSIDQIRNNRSVVNGDEPSSTYGLWANAGTGLSGYNKGRSDQVSVSVDASFDLLTGATRHAIQFGLYYQQRTERSFLALANYNGGTASLWQLAYQLTNRHITLDKANPIFIVGGRTFSKEDIKNGLAAPGPTDTIKYNYKAGNNQSVFDSSLRKKLGLATNGTDYVNVFGLDPSTFSLDMFSPDELLNSGNPFVSYQGYSYTGQIQNGQVNFNDYFTAKDANKHYTRPIGAFRPNYTAGYILDKFQINHILFNVGVRVERYDAANETLIDPYSLYQEQTVTQFDGDHPGLSHPANIGGSYIPYVDNNNSKTPNIIGYRNGDNWYDIKGNYIEDPSILKITTGRDPQPALSKDGHVKIDSNIFDPKNSFVNYTPQVNVMPRLAFSFPVSDVALFYGHYDVYSHNPASAYVITTPYDYYFMTQNANSVFNNPALKPERTFDYEMGFKQKLSDQSAVTITGFYRERKDMVTLRPYFDAYPITYFSYTNRDFSSTKGMTVSYDLRRIGHLQMTLAYTLQFADGTGSSATSTNGGSGGQVSNNGIISSLLSAGLPNLRYVFPLDIDSRHNIAANIDYRFSQGEGPVVGDRHILQNAGINLILRTRSGEPYTQLASPQPGDRTIVGQVNGSRLPWHFSADVRVDKDFAVAFGKKPAPESLKHQKQYTFNAYLLVKNVFNIRDVLGVYGYTGSSSDNGYLTSSYGKQAIPVQTNALSYTDLYRLAIQNPGLLNLPRQIFLGVQFSF